jgi:protein gp37
MFRDKERYGQDPTIVSRSKTTFNDPLKWHKKLTGNEPLTERLVFANSWSDFFLAEANPEWRKDAWKIIKDTPYLVYQILTKRPENIPEMLPPDWDDGYPNVWLGVSVESPDYLWRIDNLARTPASLRFISFEPLLAEIRLSEHYRQLIHDAFSWSILGGESGNEKGYYRYRPSEISWYQNLIYDHPRNTAIFLKQLGTHLAKKMKLKDPHGGDPSEWPEDLRVREMPKT